MLPPLPRPGSQPSRPSHSCKENDGSDRKARAAAGAGLAKLRALDSLPSGFFQGFVLASQPGPLVSSKAHCWQSHPGNSPWATETRIGVGGFPGAQSNRSYFSFLERSLRIRHFHTWYLFNSHRGHTKKLLLLIHETETPGSGTCPESDTFTAVGPAFELGPCQYAAHVCAGPGIGAAPSPGVPRWPGRAQMLPRGIGGSPLPPERAAASGFAVPVTRPSPVQAFIPSTISVITPFPHLRSSM